MTLYFETAVLYLISLQEYFCHEVHYILYLGTFLLQEGGYINY
jgi:hypothetical protein